MTRRASSIARFGSRRQTSSTARCAAGFSPITTPRPPGHSGSGRRRRRERSAWCCCSTRCRATSFAGRRAPMRPIRRRARQRTARSRRRFDQLVPPAWRLFFYMPFHHSEDIADQRRSVALFRRVAAKSGSPWLAAAVRAPLHRGHRALRAFPAPQRYPWPALDAGRDRVHDGTQFFVMSSSSRLKPMHVGAVGARILDEASIWR